MGRNELGHGPRVVLQPQLLEKLIHTVMAGIHSNALWEVCNTGK